MKHGVFVCSLWAAGSDGSGFPAALHWYFCCLSYICRIQLW